MLFVFVVVVLITTLPYFIAFTSQRNQWIFSGFFIGVDDGNSYLAKMVSGMAGSWLFRTPYTTQPQNGIVAFLPYLILGKLVNPPALHVQLIMLYQIFRIIGIGIYTVGTYQFIRIYTKNGMIRMFCMILAAMGGGLGWFLPLIGYNLVFGTIPLDFYSPETFGFLSLFGFPHLAVARGLMLAGLALFISDHNLERIGFFWRRLLPGFLLLFAGLFQPLSTAIGAMLFVFFSVLHILLHKETPGNFSKEITNLILAGIPTIPLILYNGIAEFTDPFFKAWTAQNIITSPHPIHYLLAFGLPLLVIGFNIKKLALLLRKSQYIFLVIWIILAILLAYIPFNLQRRLPDGVFIAFILVMMGIIEGMNIRKQKFLIALACIVMIPSTLMIVANGINSATHPYEPVFITKDKAESYMEISRVVKPGAKIIANFQTGNEFPVWAPVYMVMGHGPESIHLKEVQSDVDTFFSESSTDELRRIILAKYSINSVIQEKSKDIYPADSNNLPCYLNLNLETKIYRVFEVVNCE